MTFFTIRSAVNLVQPCKHNRVCGRGKYLDVIVVAVRINPLLRNYETGPVANLPITIMDDSEMHKSSEKAT